MLSAFASLIICIAVWILSGDIQNWMKFIVCAITFAILLPLIRYVRKNRILNNEQEDHHHHPPRPRRNEYVYSAEINR